LPASPTLGQNAVGAAPAASADCTSPKGGPVSRAPSSCGRCQPSHAWCADQLASPVAPLLLTRHPEFGSNEPGLALRAAHQGCTRFASPRRLPPSGPVRPDLCLRSNRGFVGRHRYSCDVAAASPASDMLSPSVLPSARPKPRAGSRRSVQATCRLPTSAVECPPSTPANRPNPAGFCCSSKPLHRRVAMSLASHCQPSCFRLGVA
jgi:hypothetical protein